MVWWAHQARGGSDAKRHERLASASACCMQSPVRVAHVVLGGALVAHGLPAIRMRPSAETMCAGPHGSQDFAYKLACAALGWEVLVAMGASAHAVGRRPLSDDGVAMRNMFWLARHCVGPLPPCANNEASVVLLRMPAARTERPASAGGAVRGMPCGAARADSEHPPLAPDRLCRPLSQEPY